MVFNFPQTPMKDELKLYVITSVIWGRPKVQSLKAKFLVIERAIEHLGIDPGNVRLLTVGAVDAYLDARRPCVGASTLGGCAAGLADFLEFHERMFGRLSDPDVIPRLREVSSLCCKIAREAEGCPCVPPDYLYALLSTAERVMRDPASDPADAITAAVLIVFAEVGFRTGECLGLEAGALEVVAGAGGMPDIAYLTFKTYKGERRDGEYRLRRTVVSSRALEAYVFLEGACARRREQLGVESLVAYPRQRARFCPPEALSRYVRRFLVDHSGEIPCVNSAGRFPGLPTVTVGDAVAWTGAKNRLPSLGLEPEDVLVYITPQMLRVTFATSLYERGYDLAIISKFMNHITSDTTVGYIRSDRRIEREMSEAVYRSMLIDDAELLGPHGDEFATSVKEYAASLRGAVYEDEDALIAACAERYPLRLKPGYVCTRCGTVAKCPSSTDTDEVFCAFGVCRNQHHMYFMVDVHIDAVRFHMRLVGENRERGHVMAARNELRKAKNVIEGTVLPELASLDEQLERHGEGHVIGRHPHLRDTVRNRAWIYEEVESWLSMEIAG